MQTNQKNNAENRKPEPGNETDPSVPGSEVPPGNNQLLNEKAEKYLRESGNIEDLPDEEDLKELDEATKGSKPA
jgi:hypothetical protein